MPPKISIILPSYNYGAYLKSTLDSIAHQTETSWELIAVDDGSTDDSLEILKRFAAGREGQVTVLTHPGLENRGLTESVRLALGLCRGEFVSFLDADDHFLPESLAKRVRMLEERPELAVAHHGVVLDGAYGPVRSRVRVLSKMILPKAGTYEALAFLLRSNVTLTLSAVMIRRSFLEKINTRSPNDPWLDWWIMTQLSVMGPFCLIPEKLVQWRIHEQSYNVLYCAQSDLLDKLPIFLDRIKERAEELLDDKPMWVFDTGRRDRLKRDLVEVHGDMRIERFKLRLKKALLRPCLQAIRSFRPRTAC